MHVLLTGGYGCIGSWIARQLLERGDRVWIYDLKEDPRRLRQILPEDRVRQVAFLPGDVVGLDQRGAGVGSAIVATAGRYRRQVLVRTGAVG